MKFEFKIKNNKHTFIHTHVYKISPKIKTENETSKIVIALVYKILPKVETQNEIQNIQQNKILIALLITG